MQRRDNHPELPFLFAEPEGAPLTASAAPQLAPLPRRPRAEPEVLSVGELDRRLRRLLEGWAGEVRVEGEISGLRVVGSGHAYFTLKDEREEAVIDCVMYRTAPPRSRRLLEDGARVVLTGRVSLYAPRGKLQLLADHAAPVGRGALLLALEQLKERLAAEGLFAPERKRRLPEHPSVIGVVTSGDGAAIHDIMTVAFRRGGVRLILARTPVQGAGAAQRMAQAIGMLERVRSIEAIIVGRGGGSADDLSAYNDEALVRKVASARVPVVSAVGHEIDTSLTDLAADARAATPSQAAEMLVPDAEARRAELAHVEARLCHTIGHRLRAARVELEGLPIERAAERFLAERRAAIGRLDRRLAERHPRAVIAAAQAELGPLEVRLEAAARRHIEALRRRFAGDVARLSAMSPLEVLARGYAIATNEAGRAVRHARDVSPGDRIAVRVHEGALLATVVATAGPGEPLPSGSGSGSGRGSGRGGRRSASEQLGLALAPERRGADG